ncbi:MAG: translation initiation factor IF-2 [Lachnospiraceae bacterium]|nr:translation initiation factor IF-2 [Lachnospiraceae bacterium]
MAKMRVHELAKELGASSRDVLEYLNSTGLELKTVSSGVDEESVRKAEAHFGKAGAKTSEPEKTVLKTVHPARPIRTERPGSPTKAEKTEKTEDQAVKEGSKPVNKENPEVNKENKEAKAQAAPRKKKPTITAVFNAQYSGKFRDHRGSKSASGDRKNGRGDRPAANGGSGSAHGDRRKPVRRDGQRTNANPMSRPLIKPRSGSGPIRADGTRKGEPTLAEQQKMQKMREAEEAKKKALEEAKLMDERARAAEAEKKAKAEAEAGSRETEGSRTAEKAAENRPASSDRQARNNEEKNSRNGRNDRNGRNEKPERNNRNDHKKNDRNDRNSRPAASSENSGKDSRKNNRKKNDRRDRNSYNDKNQERFVNLEKNGGKKNNKKPHEKKEAAEEEIKSIKLPDHITLRELAERMKIEPSQIIKKLFLQGVMITLNTSLDYDKAEEIAMDYDILCEHEEKVDLIKEYLKETDDEDPKDLVPRPPVVSVMGHVDHGKTSLLDAIRDTKVANREAGGITQKIGAYVVEANGRKITFLDTPGHEAFTAMRMRGANSTDIAVLVVAADDGVMPQTVESINHAKAAGVEIIVAVNKIDKPNANIDRVKQELSEYDLIPEDWGGSTVFCPVSAKTHEGIDNLLEMILLTADVMELKANPKAKGRGIVIESQLDKGRGVVATVLVQNGTLHVGDPVSAGSSYGKVRAMVDENGRRVKSAGPSVPVEIQGLNEVPSAGEILLVHDSDRDARNFAQEFVNEEKNKLVEESRSRMSLENLSDQIKSGSLKELDVIVKADVQGSVEAVKQSLEKLSNDEVVVKVIHGGVGAITESDVVLASASNAIIIGFNVRPDAVAKDIAEREHVDIHLYDVIYNAIEDVERAMKGMLEPVYEERVIGHAEVRQTFKASGIGLIAGCVVNDGVIERGCKIRLTRGKDQLFDGDLASLKRFKDDVKEVKAGFECGIVLKDYTSDIQEGDIMEAYKMVEVPRE